MHRTGWQIRINMRRMAGGGCGKAIPRPSAVAAPCPGRHGSSCQRHQQRARWVGGHAESRGIQNTSDPSTIARWQCGRPHRAVACSASLARSSVPTMYTPLLRGGQGAVMQDPLDHSCLERAGAVSGRPHFFSFFIADWNAPTRTCEVRTPWRGYLRSHCAGLTRCVTAVITTRPDLWAAGRYGSSVRQ